MAKAPNYTPAEDALVRDLYPDKSRWPELQAALPDRSWHALAQRAHTLGVVSTAAHWSAEDDAVLRDEWSELPITTLAARLGRTRRAVWMRATDLGLPHGVPPGCLSIKDAAAYAGYARATLRGILAAQQTEVQRVPSRKHRAAFRFLFVLREDLDAALERHHAFLAAHETVRQAAVRVAVAYMQLWRALLAAGVIAKKARRGGRHLVPVAEVDGVVAAYGLAPRRAA